MTQAPSRRLRRTARTERFLAATTHRNIRPVAWLCDALDISRSGFHAWLNRSPSARSRHDEVLVTAIDRSFKSSDRTYRARRIWHDVLAEGISCGLHRVEKLMRQNGLRARPYRRGLPKDAGERAAVLGNILDRVFGTEPEVGGRLHLHLDRRRMALRCRCRRPVLPARRRLGDDGGDDGAVCHQRPHHGDLAQRQARQPAAPFRPRIAIHQ